MGWNRTEKSRYIVVSCPLIPQEWQFYAGKTIFYAKRYLYCQIRNIEVKFLV